MKTSRDTATQARIDAIQSAKARAASNRGDGLRISKNATASAASSVVVEVTPAQPAAIARPEVTGNPVQ
jgi:hypothetical protein